jgi:predicted AlkP superfamily pyrophosphatase or phosphodiesterase
MSLRKLALAVAALSSAACAHVRSSSHIMQQGDVALAHQPSRGRITDHVVVISIDGLRPDAIAKFKATTLERLMREGRYSLTARTIDKSITLPSHTSMLTGVDSDKHGVTWNSDRTDLGYTKAMTIFGFAHDAGFTTAAFFGKAKFSALQLPGTLDFSMRQHGELGLPWGSARTTGYVSDYLHRANPNLLFVHLGETDFVGHNLGWMSRTYGQAVRSADQAVARIISSATERFGEGNFTVIVTADHGGHNHTHGTTQPVDVTIPWIVWGQGVQRGDTLSGIRTMDTAATALWMLGVAVPASFEGKPVAPAFEGVIAGR